MLLLSGKALSMMPSEVPSHKEVPSHSEVPSRLLNENTVVCELATDSVGAFLLELFERLALELFTMKPGALLTARVRAL